MIKKLYLTQIIIVALLVYSAHIAFGLTGNVLLTPPYDVTEQYSGAPSAKETIPIGFIRAGELEKVYGKDYRLAIDFIKFSFDQDIEDIKIIFHKPSTFKEGFLFPPGFTYQIFEIEFRDIGASTFASAALRFKVDKDLLSQKGFSKENIKLLKLKENAWEEINSQFIKTQAPYYIFEAQLDSFSVFAITAQKEETASQITEKIPEEPVPQEATQQTAFCGNNIIDQNENCQNCPIDVVCAQGEICEYGICTRTEQKEGIILPKAESPQKVNGKSPWFYMAIVFVILAGLFIAFIIYILAIKHRKQMPFRQTNLPKKHEFILLKSYVQGFINQGYSIEEIRRGALKSNWPENMVEEAIRQLNKKA